MLQKYCFWCPSHSDPAVLWFIFDRRGSKEALLDSVHVYRFLSMVRSSMAVPSMTLVGIRYILFQCVCLSVRTWGKSLFHEPTPTWRGNGLPSSHLWAGKLSFGSSQSFGRWVGDWRSVKGLGENCVCTEVLHDEKSCLASKTDDPKPWSNTMAMTFTSLKASSSTWKKMIYLPTTEIQLFFADAHVQYILM